jgi:hypothetical protein
VEFNVDTFYSCVSKSVCKVLLRGQTKICIDNAHVAKQFLTQSEIFYCFGFFLANNQVNLGVPDVVQANSEDCTFTLNK